MDNEALEHARINQHCSKRANCGRMRSCKKGSPNKLTDDVKAAMLPQEQLEPDAAAGPAIIASTLSR